MMSFITPLFINLAVEAVADLEDGRYTSVTIEPKVLFEAFPDFAGNLTTIYPRKVEFALFRGDLLHEELEDILNDCNGRYMLLAIDGDIEYGLDKIEGLAIVSTNGVPFYPKPKSTWAIAPLEGNFVFIN